MHTVIGNGACKIVYLNCTNAQNVDELFSRLIRTYHMMLDLGYPKQKRNFGRNRIVFTNEVHFCKDARLCIGFNGNSPGVYTNGLAYHKEIAKALSFKAGLPMYVEDNMVQNICIGIGDEPDVVINYMALKDSLLNLSDML